MDFSPSPELLSLRERTRRFIAEQVTPLEREQDPHAHGPSEALRIELVNRARSAGLLTPHAWKEMGAMGLSHMAETVVFDGNVHLMDEVAPAAQKACWLRPPVEGRTRSCFAMTEPDAQGFGAGGAAAGPGALQRECANGVRRRHQGEHGPANAPGLRPCPRQGRRLSAGAAADCRPGRACAPAGGGT